MRLALRLLLGFMLLFSSRGALAHQPSDSYLLVEGNAPQLTVRWDIALRDLDVVLGLDGDGDRAVTWAELQAADEMVKAYAADGLEVRTPGGACRERFGATQVVNHADVPYAALSLELNCPDGAVSPKIHYGLLFEVDAQHRAIVEFGSGQPLVLTKARPDAVLSLAVSGGQAFAALVRLGVEHILEGYDHLLFLLALLLPAVLRREQGRWVAATSFRLVWRDVLKVVTAFTVAHSITLALAAAHVVALPSRVVEAAIAFSVVLVSLNNVWPVVGSERWLAAFGLGLLHGFGFASVLQDVGLPPGAFVRAVLGFNLGVELGQLGLVLLLLPILHRARTSRFYQAWGLTVGSLVVLGIASVWLVERAFGLKLIS